MYWYVAFTAMFVLYQLDVLFYSLVALAARVSEALWPVPGHPLYSSRRGGDELVEPPDSNERGYLVGKAPCPGPPGEPGPAGGSAADMAEPCVPLGGQGKQQLQQHEQHEQHEKHEQQGGDELNKQQGHHMEELHEQQQGWQIPTAAAAAGARVSVSSSLASSSCAAGSSSGVVGSSSGSSAAVPSSAGSDCAGSSAYGGSHPSTPHAPVGTPRAALHRILGRATSQLSTVYSLPQPESPSASSALPHHPSAAGLRFRLDDGAKRALTPRGAGPGPQGALGAVSIPIGGGPPPPSSAVAVAGPGSRSLLPASLVAMYPHFPVVLVQLPMYNEEAHCEVVIERACNILWPRDRIVIQACDDSTREDVKCRIDAKVAEMAARGHNVLVSRRATNKGFKAGNMINGMEQLAELPWEYVAVFDCDFEMPPDFLYQTIWHMQEDPKLGFVQTRWSFTNSYDNLLCWMQSVALAWHFAVEQRARSFMRTFFGFNGTAGVWRRAAMEQAGGWNTDSTVEDMDLSLRAYLFGWKFRYLHWVSCPNELPPTMSAYKTQQFRWNSGPMVVIKQLLARIWTTSSVTFADRISCSYFFVRFIYTGFLTLICLLCPAIMIWLDPWQWTWPPMAFLIAGNTSALCFVWFSGAFFWPYLLLQAGIGYFRVFAMANGLLGSTKAGTWKVTKKFGKGAPGGKRQYHKPYFLEFLLAAVFLSYAVAAVWHAAYVLAAFCWVMAWTCLLYSFGDYIF